MPRHYVQRYNPLHDFADVILELNTTEVTVQCPECLTIETLELDRDKLRVCGKWSQRNNDYYHKPCGCKANILSWY